MAGCGSGDARSDDTINPGQARIIGAGAMRAAGIEVCLPQDKNGPFSSKIRISCAK
jgi:hypothetical protein